MVQATDSSALASRRPRNGLGTEIRGRRGRAREVSGTATATRSRVLAAGRAARADRQQDTGLDDTFDAYNVMLARLAERDHATTTEDTR